MPKTRLTLIVAMISLLMGSASVEAGFVSSMSLMADEPRAASTAAPDSKSEQQVDRELSIQTQSGLASTPSPKTSQDFSFPAALGTTGATLPKQLPGRLLPFENVSLPDPIPIDLLMVPIKSKLS